MKIAILSGKGGTGKTLLSVNLATVMGNATYIDCDVEEPNGHLFFKPQITLEKEVKIYLPVQDVAKCNGCRKCVDFCKFNALAYVNKKLVVFDEVCHSCEGCKMLCEPGAITMRPKTIGIIKEGFHNNNKVNTGILNMGEASGVPIIKELLKSCNDDNVVVDCPPGSACVVMESIRDVDYCVLVAEPTIFGVHNLNMVYNLVKIFDKKLGVVLNKCIDGENIAEEYCNKHDIKVLGRIEFSKELGEINSNGLIASEVSEKYHNLFEEIYNNILREAK